MVYYSSEKLIIRDIEKEDSSSLEYSPDDFDENGVSSYKLEYFWNKSEEHYHQTIVAIYDGNFAGFVNICEPGMINNYQPGNMNSTFFYDLYVLRNYRLRGIGSQLMRFAEMRARNCSAEMWCYSLHTNTYAHSFYQKRGFVKDDSCMYLNGKVVTPDSATYSKYYDELEYRFCKVFTIHNPDWI